MQVEINVLGSFEASAAGMSIVPSAGKQRQILALLALNAGRLVTVRTVTEELWGMSPPRSVATTVHTYISQLRRKLEPAMASRARSSRDILATEHIGYRLNIDPADTDAGRYDQFAAIGRRAADAGDCAKAADSLRVALNLWRGPALADVVTGSHLSIEVVRLTESRLSDLDLRIEADLRLRRHQRVLSELAVLCAQHPMLESFHAQYMFALYRSSRQWRSLEVYQQLRATMVDELGVEPSIRLRQLHQAILAADPVLDDPAYAGGARRPVSLAG